MIFCGESQLLLTNLKAATMVLANRRRIGPLRNTRVKLRNRYSEDFERCRKSGINAFRLGIEWSRVQPTFSNQKGARLLLIIRHDRRRLDPLRLFSLSLRTGRINRQFVWINRLHPESPSDSPRETTLRIEPDFTRSTNRCTA